jgi:hypothetical protein
MVERARAKAGDRTDVTFSVADAATPLPTGEYDAVLCRHVLLALVRESGRDAELHQLTDAVYWGRQIDDERYLVVA